MKYSGLLEGKCILFSKVHFTAFKTRYIKRSVLGYIAAEKFCFQKIAWPNLLFSRLSEMT